MGRTNPTYRDAIRGLESEWEPMGRALRRPHRPAFDRLFDRARAFADAAGHANPRDPGRALVLSIALAHEVELQRLRDRVAELESATIDDDGAVGSDGGAIEGPDDPIEEGE